MSGTLTPDATGSFVETGVYATKAYYRRGDGSYFIWWSVAQSAWIISALLGTPGTAYWQGVDETITTTYSPEGTAEGTATVSETP